MTKSKQPSSAGNARPRSGGGATMNKVRNVGVRAGPPNTKKISASAAANLGNMKGNHAMGSGKILQRPADPLIQGTRPQVPSGNAVALNGAGAGARPGGGGRVVSPCGSQGQHGAAVQGIAPQLTPGGGPGSFGFKAGGR